jgi:hypothetical protein
MAAYSAADGCTFALGDPVLLMLEVQYEGVFATVLRPAGPGRYLIQLDPPDRTGYLDGPVGDAGHAKDLRLFLANGPGDDHQDPIDVHGDRLADMGLMDDVEGDIPPLLS